MRKCTTSTHWYSAMFSYRKYLFFPNLSLVCMCCRQHREKSFSGEQLSLGHYFLNFMMNCRFHIKRQILHFKTLTHVVLNNWSLCDLEFRNELSIKIDSFPTFFWLCPGFIVILFRILTFRTLFQESPRVINYYWIQYHFFLTWIICQLKCYWNWNLFYIY